jgi:chorismate mutase
MNDELEVLRAQVDALDGQILQLLAKRMDQVKVIGAYKRLRQLPALDDSRWQQASLARTELAKQLGLSETLVSELFEVIHKHSVHTEQDAGAQ